MLGIQTKRKKLELETRQAARDAMVAYRDAYEAYGGWLRDFLSEGYGLDPSISEDDALKIPAVWAAINLLASELSSMPIKLHEKDSHKEVDNEVAQMVSIYPNPHTPSDEYRLQLWTDVFTYGCHASWIERSSAGRPRYLWRLDPRDLRAEYNEATMEPVFRYRVGKRTGRQDYNGRDVIYITFRRAGDALTAINPIRKFALALHHAIASMQYANKLYENGGVPPLMLSGPMSTGAGLVRASEDMGKVIEDLSQEGRKVLPIPEGHDLKELVITPDRMQNIPQQEWSVAQAGRIWGVPVSMIGDRSQATYSNIEQEDLRLVKHTLLRWVKILESQLNLKVLGYANRSQHFKHNMDGILRGDYKTRIEGNARAIQTGQLTPNEARALEDREPVEGGDVAYTQGANIPLIQAGTMRPVVPQGGKDD